MLLALPDVPLCTTSFDVEDRWLLWARVQLYHDRLVLTGWSLSGRHVRQIPLSQIEETAYGKRRLRLDLEDEEEVTLLIAEAGRWARLIAAQRYVGGSLR
jgi:hypothetical protein